MTYTLYWRERSGAFGPHAVLAELGLAAEEVRIDSKAGDNRTADYLAINPHGRIPALRLPDGEVMTESAAIALYLAELHPGAGLVPPPGDPRRAAVLRWLFFAVANLYETDLRFTYPDRYTSDPAGAAGVREAAEREFEANWAIAAGAFGEGGPYLLGGCFSIADPYLAMIAVWHPEPKRLLARLPALGRLVEAVRMRPALAALWERYGFNRDL